MRQPVLWRDAHAHKKDKVVIVQSVIRGWIVRNRLRMAGPGVLSRKNLVNDEDLVTYDEKDKVHPMDYFSITENGKTWWFRFDTIYQWCLQNPVPTNPYTKTPLSAEARKRLRDVWRYKRRHRELPPESKMTIDRMRGRWNLLCQLFEDYGFGNINPETFYQLRRSDYIAIFRMIRDDIRVLLKDSNIHKEALLTYCALGEERAKTQTYMSACPYVLLVIVSRPRDPYVIAFTILSALYRY